MGEPAWSNEEQTERLVMKHHLGMHDEIHNVYGLTWDKVVKEQFEKRNPDRRVFQMTRAAYAGLQRYTFGWTGDSGNGDDVLQGWGQLANQIPVMLSAGLGLIPFSSCDITGYCGDIEDYPAMAELYTRWIQFGAFNPLSRIHHEGDNPVEPWLFGPEAEKNAKAAIELKYRLLPYIYTYAREAYDTGLPIMRPLFLEYPMDMETFSTDAQFIFGRELLVAPVVKKGARTKNVYLPEGTWIDYNNKQAVYTGEQWTTVDAPLSSVPIFVKQGSIIPTMPVMNYTHEKPVYPLTFEIFPAQEGAQAAFTLYEDEGEDLGYQRHEFVKTPIICSTLANGYELTVSAREGKGSETELFKLDMGVIGLPWTGANAPSLAVSGNNLVVCLGDGTTTPAYYNASTGNKIGNVTLGSVSVASLGCMTSDSRGNILLATKATNGKSFSIYKTSSVTTAPTLLTTYTNNTGLDMGTKVSVQGDINTNASIIATCDGTASSGSNKFVRWIITDGVLGSPQVVTVNGVGNWGAPASNTKVVTKGTTAQSDYFLSYYDSNILYWVNGTNNNASKSLEDSDNGNSWAMNNNCLDTRSFNNAQYLVLVCTAHFPQWGGTPCLYMYDVTSDGSFTGTISTSDALSFNPSLSSYNSSDGVAATGDVLLAPTTDGYKLRAYYVDNNCKVIGGYEFDCIDK